MIFRLEIAAVHLTMKSRNRKVGRIPVSTMARDSCPPACPLMSAGCYAEHGPLGMLWRALSAARAGRSFKFGKHRAQALTWSAFCSKVAAFKRGQLWRHNQAGDLPGHGDAIDPLALSALVAANSRAGARGFTYTHKPVTGPHGPRNAAAIAAANAAGFTVNLSADTAPEADALSMLNIGPVVVVLPQEIQGHQDIMTPGGRRVVVCPATYHENVTCESCRLCAIHDRNVIVGFPAHGTARRRASNTARGQHAE